MLSLTDLVSLFKMPLEQWIRTERLFFVFPEPFNKEVALKQFKSSNKTTPSHSKLIYYQKMLLEQIVDILDKYVTLYEKYGNTFIQLLPSIEEPYYFLSLSLKDIECYPSFPFKVLYAKYDMYLLYLNSITKDPETLIKNWKKNRSKVIDLIASTQNFLFNNPYSEEKRPQLFDDLVLSLQTGLNDIEKKLTNQKENEMNKQKDSNIISLPNTFKQDDTDPLLFHLGNYGSIRMGSEHTAPTIILQMQIAAKGNLVPVREMLEEINKRRKSNENPLVPDDVRRKIAQLNKRLVTATNGNVEIRESGQGSYHLWYNVKT